jgi:hypothetical protein
MSPRSIRRAAERKAIKQARKASRLSEAVTEPQRLDEAALLSEPKTQASNEAALLSEPKTQALDETALLSEPKTQAIDSRARASGSTSSPEPSASRIQANRANSQLSTGPKTPEGKAKSSVNAVKTALTGRTVLLPTDDVAAYQEHVQRFIDEFKPVGHRESELVQALSDHSWRLNRIATLEMAIYAYGHEQFAQQFAHRGEMQGAFTEMHTFLQYEKQLRNLQIQETRIRRNRDKDVAELRQLQDQRTLKEREEPKRAAAQAPKPTTAPRTQPETIHNGFVFSTSNLEAFPPDTLAASAHSQSRPDALLAEPRA